MPDPVIAPYGSWKSPLTAAQVAAGQAQLGQVEVCDGLIYWTESRPAEGGRVAIMRRLPGELPREATPPGFNCRTRVHEYGGGAYWPIGEAIFCSQFRDQRLYRIDPSGAANPITPEPELAAGLRYADARALDPGRLVCVREHHRQQGQPINEIVALPRDGSTGQQVLASGRDFYASPRLSPDGRQLCWLAWDHPRMPWDGTELWLAELRSDGAFGEPRLIAGGVTESIFQPEWSPQGELHFVSDRSGWWNLYRVGQSRPLIELQAEFGAPQWSFGMSRYCFTDEGAIACIYTVRGMDALGLLLPGGEWRPLDTGFNSFNPASLRWDSSSGRLICIAAAPKLSPAVIAIDPATGQHRHISAPDDPALPSEFISAPHSIEFPTGQGETAHALFFPPHNPQHQGPAKERPPLIVISHGGPTGQTRPELRLGVQYWTTRGFAVVDVNYRGSAGFGRAYRQRLNGQWGIVDVEDCLEAARYLVAGGRVDGERLIIRGGSAGGYTTLCALTFHDLFAAGASYYGVADVEALAHDTHKFESRYLDSMIGPYPQAAELYRERSPIHFTERIACPLILLQGMEDPVVPPAQAEMMVQALQQKGLPYAYLAFEGEAHGFRSAQNLQRALEAERYFYARVFGLELAEPIEPIEIANL